MIMLFILACAECFGMSERGKKIYPYDLIKMKEGGEIITMTVAYDYPMASLIDQSGIDVILVGDSGGVMALGYDNTTPVTMREMIHFCKAVTRAAKRCMVVGDLPFMSYHVSPRQAVRNAGRLVKLGGVDSVKLEGGSEFAPTVKAIVDAGIPVMAHIGLTPQTATALGGYRVQGRTAKTAKKVIDDAIALEKAGVFAVTTELVTAEVAKILKKRLSVPLIGIGSGIDCDGQVLLAYDILGLFQRYTPPFVRRYANLSEQIVSAMSRFREDIRARRFPGEEHTFHMEKEEYEKLMAEL
jgi:3-methyl-2-oxobutanoate hydroxymethyltransferase